MNRDPDSAGSPAPRATRVGQDRLAPAQTADPLPDHNGDDTARPAAPDQDQRPETAKLGGKRSARIAAQHAQIGIPDPAAQPKSP
jgi:hypothetical protein